MNKVEKDTQIMLQLIEISQNFSFEYTLCDIKFVYNEGIKQVEVLETLKYIQTKQSKAVWKAMANYHIKPIA